MKSSLTSDAPRRVTAPANLLREMQRLRVIGALRLVLTLMLCMLVAAVFHMTTGVLSLAPPLVMVIFMHDESLKGGLDLILGSLLGTVLFLILAGLLYQAHLLFLLAGLAVVLGLSYWAAQGMRGRWPSPFAAVFALLNLSSAYFASISQVDLGSNAAIGWLQEIIIGVCCAWFVLIGLWPSPKAGDLARLSDGIQAECAHLLRDLAVCIAEDRPVTYRASPVSLVSLGNLLKQIDSLRWRLATAHPGHDALWQRLANLRHLYLNTRVIARAMEDVAAGDLRPATRQALIDLLSGIADQILERHPTLDRHAGDIEAARAVIRARSRVLGGSPEKPDNRAGRLSVKLAAIASSTDALMSDVQRLAGGEARALSPPSPTEAKQAITWFQVDSAKVAIKMTLGILLGLSLHLLPSVPAGSYLVLGMVIILAQPNLGRAHLRVRLWIPGIIGGTLYSLLGLALISVVPDFGLLLAWLALGFLIGGYFGAGPDRVSYAGLQFCLGMAVILGASAFPISTVVVAEERVIGAVIGFGIGLLIAHVVWPVHPADLLRQQFAQNLRGVAEILRDFNRYEDGQSPALRSQIITLRQEVLAGFGLLYDISYLVIKRLRPAYDYRGITHALGVIYVQIWALYETLDTADDSAKRDGILVALRKSETQLTESIETLARQIEAGDMPDHGAFIATLRQLAEDITSQIEETIPGLEDEERWRLRFGLHTMREFVYQLALIADYSDAAQNQTAPHTKTLARIYEGLAS